MHLPVSASISAALTEELPISYPNRYIVVIYGLDFRLLFRSKGG